jgi:hypothetical protein
MVTSHAALLSGLIASTTYHYRVKSKDAAGNPATSGDFSFLTTAGADPTPLAPTITSISPTKGRVGTTVVIKGTGFGGSQGSSTVTFVGITAAVISWSDTSISVTVPAKATGGAVVVTVNGVQSNSINFQVSNKLPPPGKIRIKG